MNSNPYQSSETQQPAVQHLRNVVGWVAGSVFAAMAAVTPLWSGLHLAGQEFGLFPVPYGVFGIEINGTPVSNRSFMWASLLAGGLFIGIAVVCFLRVRINQKHNATVRSAGSQTIR